MLVYVKRPPVVFGMSKTIGVAGLGDETATDSFSTATGAMKWLAIAAAAWFLWTALKSSRRY